MSKFMVAGAGMAGLLAAAVLRDECVKVTESQASLPNNHSALLRFRSSIVGDTLNIPFAPVNVIKSVISTGNPIADSVKYSMKTNGTATLRSIVQAEGKIEERFIAPSDFISQMRNKISAPVEFGAPWDGKAEDHPVISTLPMPTLMNILGYEHDIKFRSVNGYVSTAKLRNCDICATIYIPDSGERAYRASITKDVLMVEYAFPNMHSKDADREMVAAFGNSMAAHHKHISGILKMFGLTNDSVVGVPTLKAQPYAKILPIDDSERKRFMLWATETHNIYSYGRFATWKPNLLMDDLVSDLKAIQKMARSGTTYDRKK